MTIQREPGWTRLPMMEYADIDEPGAYLVHETGMLVRVPVEELRCGHCPPIAAHGGHPMLVSQLSQDPWIPMSEIKAIAASYDLTVNV